MPRRLSVSHYIVLRGGARMSYNDLVALPKSMGDSLQLSLRPSRKYAAHRGFSVPCYRDRIVVENQVAEEIQPAM